MKRHRLNKKEIVKKKIELRHSRLNFIEKDAKTQEIVVKEQPKKIINQSMKERDKLRIFGTTKLNNISFKQFNYKKETQIQYQKKVFVDYDIVICIPSFNRYNKIIRLIKQFYEQKTKYTFKIILLNDGSTDIKYNKITKVFHEISYIKNDVPNGKALHWYCYNQMWNLLRNIECHAILEMDDDFIICDNFLDTICDLFFQKKMEDGNIMAIAPHLWSFKNEDTFENWWKRNDFIDGIALIDVVVIKYMDYMMKPVDINIVSQPGKPVQTWIQITNAIKMIDGYIYRTENSLVYHDGNDDSKLHGDVRKNNLNGVYTQRYIGNL